MNFDEILGYSEIVVKDKTFSCQLIAEFLGTFFIVLIGCGSTIFEEVDHASAIIKISFAFGFSVGSVIETIGHVSGGYVNPAVTIAMMLVHDIKVLPALLYIIIQLLGATSGAAILKALTPANLNSTLGLNIVHDKVTTGQALGVEFVVTFFFILLVFSIVDMHRKNVKGAASAVGLAVTVLHMFAIPYTGCGLNPARVFASAAVTGNWTNQWIYWVGECTGAIMAAYFYVIFLSALKDTIANRCARIFCCCFPDIKVLFSVEPIPRIENTRSLT